MNTHNQTSKKALIFSLVMIGILAVSACSPATPVPPTPAPTQDIGLVQTQAAGTVVADMTKNAPIPATGPTATPTLAPPPGPTPHPDIPVAVIPSPAQGEPAAVANYNTTIYSGPGTNYVVYASFLGGKTAKVVGKSDDGLWWAISLPVSPTGAGWVDSHWVTVSNAGSVPVLPTPPVPPTVDLVAPGPNDPQATALVNVYIRTGPATNFPAYGIANAGVSGRVIGKSEDGQWWVMRLNPQKVGAGFGWVMAQYTQASNVDKVQTIQNPTTSVTIVTTAPPSGAPVALAVDFVNIRSGPGTNYPVLGVVSPGSTAEVSGKSADGAWWQVKIPTQYAADGAGWVSAGFVITQNTGSVAVVSPPPAPPAAPTPPVQIQNTACSLVWKSPADNTVFSPGTAFSASWVLRNTGSSKWPMGEVDLAYVSAAANLPMHEGSDHYDITADVEPGQDYNFTVPMVAPFEPGAYGELWELRGLGGSGALCQFYVYINVK